MHAVIANSNVVGRKSYRMISSSQISTVIVNYNAGILLFECVLKAMAQTGQIVVVDNASTDTSIVELRRRFPDSKQLSIIQLNKNKGFAAGCNIGLKKTTAPFILFLNPDCFLSDGAASRLYQVIEAEDQVGMVGGRLLNLDGSEQGGSRRAIPTPWRALVRALGLYRLARFFPNLFFDFHLHKQPLPQTPIEVEAISGALMLVRREAIEKVGLWDEDYFLHCEDLDWCMRFRQKNWKIVFVPDVEVLHHQGACSHTRPFFVAWHKHKGMLRFYRKFFLNRYPILLTWLVSTGVWLRFVVVVAVSGTIRLVRLLGMRHD
jgi:GT2 family glycosyltransferase